MDGIPPTAMGPSVRYHCPCLSTSPVPPPPHLPSSSHHFHPLHNLFFCEECDAVRCNRCVSVEVSTYYCPNCLFEVPSASVRAEKNRLINATACIMKVVTQLDATDVLATAFHARAVGIHFLWYLQILPKQPTRDFLHHSTAQGSLPSFSIATTADGILLRLE